MAKIVIDSTKRVVATFTKGRVEALITYPKGGKPVYAIQVNGLTGVSALELMDYVDAIRKVCKKVGATIRKDVSLKGKRIDPDEPEINKDEELTVSFQIFPKDTAKHLYFTRYSEDGRVKASVQGFTFTDIPSAVQVAFVAEQAANLMKEYAEI